MSQKLKRRKHLYNLLQEVVYDNNGTQYSGIVLSRFYKLPKKGGAEKEEPYYIISGFGPAIWENYLSPVYPNQNAQPNE